MNTMATDEDILKNFGGCDNNYLGNFFTKEDNDLNIMDLSTSNYYMHDCFTIKSRDYQNKFTVLSLNCFKA